MLFFPRKFDLAPVWFSPFSTFLCTQPFDNHLTKKSSLISNLRRLEMDPSNTDAQKLRQKIAAAQQRNTLKERSLYKGMFGSPAPSQSNDTASWLHCFPASIHGSSGLNTFIFHCPFKSLCSWKYFVSFFFFSILLRFLNRSFHFELPFWFLCSLEFDWSPHIFVLNPNDHLEHVVSAAWKGC